MKQKKGTGLMFELFLLSLFRVGPFRLLVVFVALFAFGIVLLNSYTVLLLLFIALLLLRHRLRNRA